MHRRKILIAICGLSSVLCSPALACVPFMYLPTVADARVRTNAGKWRPIHIEASGSRLRLEYASSASASGRVAVVGEVERGVAFWFPIRPDGTALPNSRARKTSWSSALSSTGLPADFLVRSAASWGLAKRWKGHLCRPAIVGWDTSLSNRTQLCIHVPGARTDWPGNLTGIPIYAADAAARRIFEVTSMSNQPVSGYRLGPPQPVGQARSGAGCGLSGSGE